MKKLLLIIVSGLAFVLTACTPKTLTMKDNGKTITLKPKEIFAVQLRGNVSTGNRWKIAKMDTLLLNESKQHSFKADDNRTGSSGTYTWYFKASGKGQTTLKMDYVPVSGQSGKVAKTFSLHLVIR